MKGYMITDSHHEDNVLITVSSYGETVYVGPARPYELPTEEERLIEYVEYISELINYIKFVGEELDETASMAHTHGWRTSRYKEGVELRAKLDRLSKSLLLPKFTNLLKGER